jgi:hypothetical protein
MCKRLKFYEVVNNDDRRNLFSDFNAMNSKDEQDSYLAGLIAVIPIRRRRSRCVPEESGTPHIASVKYKVQKQ